MDKKLQNKLYRRYPELYIERFLDGSKTRMCDGFRCGDGWFNIIDDLSKKLTYLADVMGISITAFQVKEKSGSMRFYVRVDAAFHNKKSKTILSDIIRDVITAASINTSHTCELCGEYAEKGTSEINGWYIVRCDKCLKRMKAKKNK